MVVGGSAIGIEIAVELARVKIHTTLIELKPTLMPGRLEPDMSQMVQQFLETQGVVVRLNQGVKEITGQTRVKSVITDEGEFPADFVVIATGVAPNTELAEGQGLRARLSLDWRIIKDFLRLKDLENFYLGLIWSLTHYEAPECTVN